MQHYEFYAQKIEVDGIELQFINTKVENLSSLKNIRLIRELVFNKSPVNSILPIMDHDSLEWFFEKSMCFGTEKQ